MVNEDAPSPVSSPSDPEFDSYSQNVNAQAEQMASPQFDPNNNIPMQTAQFWDKNIKPTLSKEFSQLSKDVVLSYIPEKEIGTLTIISETIGAIDTLMKQDEVNFETKKEKIAWDEEVGKIKNVFEEIFNSKVELYRGVNGFSAKLVGANTQNVQLGRLGSRPTPGFVSWIKGIFGMR